MAKKQMIYDREKAKKKNRKLVSFLKHLGVKSLPRGGKAQLRGMGVKI